MSDPDIHFKIVKAIHTLPLPPVKERSSIASIKEEFTIQAVNSVLANRLKTRVREEGSPLSSAVSVTNTSGRDLYVNLLTISPRNGVDLETAFIECQREVERLLRYGVSDEEIENARFEVYKRYRLNEGGDKETNGELVKVCLGHFLNGLPCIHSSQLKEIQQNVLSSITREEVEAYARKLFSTPGAYACGLNSEEVSSAITKERCLFLLDSLKNAPIQPKEFTFNNLSIDVNLPAGTIVSESRLKEDKNARVWKLSNGAEVYYRPCESLKKANRIRIEYIFENGGYNAIDLSNKAKASYALSYMRRMTSLRGMEKAALSQQPALLGINNIISVSSAYSSVVITGPKLEDAFKVGNIQLTEPYFGTDKELKRSIRQSLKSISEPKQPMQEFADSVNAILLPYSPMRGVDLDTASVEAVDLAFVEDCFNRAFGDISGMKVFIASDYDEETVKDCVCKYIASIPAKSGPAVPKAALVPDIKSSATIDIKKPEKKVALSYI